MANNYTSFSFHVENITDEEVEWLEKETRKAYVEEVLEEDFNPERNYYPHEKCGEKSNGNYWFHDGNTFVDTGVIATILMRFLKKFRPNQYIAFELAYTCDKPRINEFGGSACFITRAGVRWMDTANWIARQIKKFETRAVGVILIQESE